MANDEDSSHLLATEVRVADSLLVTAADVAWVDQRGIETAERFQEMLDWSATRVVFAGTDQFWRMTNVTSGQATQLDYAAWDAFWGSSRETDCRHLASAALLKPIAREHMSAVTPLLLTAAVRQLTAGEDTTDIQPGCNIDLLPVPASEVPDQPSE